MKHPPEAGARHGAAALSSRRAFLRRALLATAFVAPALVSYPRTVFAAHCTGMFGWQREFNCGGNDHMFFGMTWSPGCSRLT